MYVFAEVLPGTRGLQLACLYIANISRVIARLELRLAGTEHGVNSRFIFRMKGIPYRQSPPLGFSNIRCSSHSWPVLRTCWKTTGEEQAEMWLLPGFPSRISCSGSCSCGDGTRRPSRTPATSLFVYLYRYVCLSIYVQTHAGMYGCMYACMFAWYVCVCVSKCVMLCYAVLCYVKLCYLCYVILCKVRQGKAR